MISYKLEFPENTQGFSDAYNLLYGRCLPLDRELLNFIMIEGSVGYKWTNRIKKYLPYLIHDGEK